MSDLDKGLDPLETASEATKSEVILLLLSHARSLGKDEFGYYKKFTTNSVRTLGKASSIGKHSEKLIGVVCVALTTQSYSKQFDEIIETNGKIA
jgi:hypothetical protein